MRKRFCEAVLFLCLIGFIIAGSSTESHIVIAGCSFNYDGDLITVSAGSCSSGDEYGLFYCDDDYSGYTTTQDRYGCSRGGTDVSDPCCPSGMFCNSTTFLCEQRIDNCFIFDNEGGCEEVGCFWMDGICIDSKSDYGCDYYNDSSSCEADYWNLGEEGIGTDHCGDSFECEGVMYYVDNCSCEWYEDFGCQISLTAQQKFYGGGDPSSFFCTNDYSLGECGENGVQTVDWTSYAEVVQGFGGVGTEVPRECLEEIGCSSGTGERFCGEELIKLSFFSGISFIVVLGFIVLYYFFREE